MRQWIENINFTIPDYTQNPVHTVIIKQNQIQDFTYSTLVNRIYTYAKTLTYYYVMEDIYLFHLSRSDCN